MIGRRLSALRIAAAFGVACTVPVQVAAQVSDSLAYVEELYGSELSADDVLEEDKWASSSNTRNRGTPYVHPVEQSGINRFVADGNYMAGGRFSVRMAWSPHRWLGFSGSVLREAGEPVRFDPGDQWFAGEHSSGFIRLGGQQLWLAVGDFRFRSAAALSTIGMRPTEPSRQSPARATIRLPDVRPYSGASQQPAPRGLVLSASSDRGWKASTFASARMEDGHRPDEFQSDVLSALRKSWRLSTPSSLEARRQIRLNAFGGSLAYTHRRTRAGLSWTRFSAVGVQRSALEAMWQWGQPPSTTRPRSRHMAASMGYGPGGKGILAWTFEASVPLSGVILALYNRVENPNAAFPWGPSLSLHPQKHLRQATVVSMQTRRVAGTAMVWGLRYDGRTPQEHGLPDSRQVATWIYMERSPWSIELRMKQQEDPSTGLWNGQARLTVRTESTPFDHIRVRVHAVAARAGGLAARVYWQPESHARVVLGRAVIWGRDSDPWAVLVTDRAPGQLGLLRMTGPTTHWSLRLEANLRTNGKVSLSVNQRVRQAQMTGRRQAEHKLILSLEH